MVGGCEDFDLQEAESQRGMEMQRERGGKRETERETLIICVTNVAHVRWGEVG